MPSWGNEFVRPNYPGLQIFCEERKNILKRLTNVRFQIVHVEMSRFRNDMHFFVAGDHPLATRESVSLAELRGLHILMDGNVGIWQDIVLGKLDRSDLLIQESFDAFSELIDASRLPLFNTDQYIVSDPEAKVTYWLTALTGEQKAYRSIFNAARGNLFKNT